VSENNPGFYKVVKAYFVYDSREEQIYQEYEDQLDSLEREEAEQRANNQANPEVGQSLERNLGQDSVDVLDGANIASENNQVLPRSSSREWMLRSRPPPLTEENISKYSGSANQDSKNSDEFNDIAARKRVESFEIEYAGLSRSNSSGSIGDKFGADNKISEKFLLKSFDFLNKEESFQKGKVKIESQDDSSTNPSSSFVLPPLRPRVRSYEAHRGNSPYLAPTDKASLKQIDEREEEQNYD
jgi:hypothetical protein